MNASTPEDSDENARLRRQYTEIALLAGGLAHEVRNPLSTISMNLQLLTEDVPDDGSQESRRLLMKIDSIRRECSHLERILNAFLQFTRVGELTLERTDLNQVVREFIEFFRPEAVERGVEISFHLEPDLPAVELDSDLFRQVLMNLGRNALDAMPEGGMIELQSRREGERILLELIDSGQGMEPKVAARIFEVFYSRKPGGSGLGLPTVRKIIEAHHGEIHCDSEPGRGTRMTVTLPVPNA